MKRALLISIHPEWAEKIFNGEKTIEVRTWIPKDYAGWVYVAITKGKPYLSYNLKLSKFGTLTEKELNSVWYNVKTFNGEVAFRFWFENYQTIKWEQNYYEYVAHDLLLNACLTNEQVKKYGKGRTLYAWHIDKLEIFDKPKELSEFGLTKAPQKCAWVYTNEQPQLREPKVLDEEIPSEKDENERKPF